MRKITEINNGWLFSKSAKNPPLSLPDDWENVDLPHTWNGEDGQDGGNDYYRAKCFYAKELLKSDFQAVMNITFSLTPLIQAQKYILTVQN